MSKDCFVFSSSRDYDVYRYLIANHLEAMAAIETKALEAVDSDLADFDDAESSEASRFIAEAMEDDVYKLFVEQSPIEFEYGPGGGGLEIIDGAESIFGDLLNDAVCEIDFVSVAMAFVVGVELGVSVEE